MQHYIYGYNNDIYDLNQQLCNVNVEMLINVHL